MADRLLSPSTIYESKGLEFNDVGVKFAQLRYSCSLRKFRFCCTISSRIQPSQPSGTFFTKSRATKTSILAQESLLVSVWRCVICFVNVKLDVSGIIYSFLLQLKHLYVAVTRARMNLWILDSSGAGEHLKVGRSHSVHRTLPDKQVTAPLGKQGSHRSASTGGAHRKARQVIQQRGEGSRCTQSLTKTSVLRSDARFRAGGSSARAASSSGLPSSQPSASHSS